jgi:hypothetical protein
MKNGMARSPEEEATIMRTRVQGCPACLAGRVHAANEWKLWHRWAGHGFDRGHWSDPALVPVLAPQLPANAAALARALTVNTMIVPGAGGKP